jgi:hypothetical protein
MWVIPQNDELPKTYMNDHDAVFVQTHPVHHLTVIFPRGKSGTISVLPQIRGFEKASQFKSLNAFLTTSLRGLPS